MKLLEFIIFFLILFKIRPSLRCNRYIVLNLKNLKLYERFHPGDFEHHFFGPVDVGYPEHKQFIGPQCCAKDWITFHERNHNHFDRLIEFMDLILK